MHAVQIQIARTQKETFNVLAGTDTKSLTKCAWVINKIQLIIILVINIY